MPGRTTKIAVRQLSESDFAPVRDMFDDWDFLAGTMRLPHPTLEDVRKRLSPRDGVYRWAADVEDDFAGLLEMETYPDVPRHRHAGDVHLIATHPSHRGKGVGRALLNLATDMADNWLNLRRLGLTVWVDNTRAIALYESCGFEVEGTLREYVYRNGDYVDGYVMSRIKR